MDRTDHLDQEAFEVNQKDRVPLVIGVNQKVLYLAVVLAVLILVQKCLSVKDCLEVSRLVGQIVLLLLALDL